MNELTYFDIDQRIGITFLSEDEQFLFKRFSPNKSYDGVQLFKFNSAFFAINEVFSLKNAVE